MNRLYSTTSQREAAARVLEPQSPTDQLCSLLAGGLLLGFGATRSFPWNGILLLSGSLLALRGLNGCCGISLAARRGQRSAMGEAGDLAPQRPEAGSDQVEEASWESFPASDPPASY